MSLIDVLQILFWTAVSIAIGTWIVFAYWRLRSNRIRNVHGNPPLRSSRELTWRDPRAARSATPPCRRRYCGLVLSGVDFPRWHVMQVTRASAPAARGTAASSWRLI